MDEYWTREGKILYFKSIGLNVRINEFTKLVDTKVIEVGEGTRFCDFVFIYPGPGVKIGKNCDFQPGVKVWGGGPLTMGDNVSIGPNTVLLTGLYAYQDEEGKSLQMVDLAPEESKNACYKGLAVEDDVYIGANCVVLPGCTLGRGCIIGAGAVVTKPTEAWGVYMGVPADLRKWRPSF
jgi:acetyltransferase-like isoleucine patch superfamily enzyme